MKKHIDLVKNGIKKSPWTIVYSDFFTRFETGVALITVFLYRIAVYRKIPIVKSRKLLFKLAPSGVGNSLLIRCSDAHITQ